MDRRIAPGTSGRVPLAVIVVDAAGLVSHWSTGARRLFGWAREEAVGRAAADLLPVGGVLAESDHGAAYPRQDALGPDLESSLAGGSPYPAAGRARLFDRAMDAAESGDGTVRGRQAANLDHRVAAGARRPRRRRRAQVQAPSRLAYGERDRVPGEQASEAHHRRGRREIRDHAGRRSQDHPAAVHANRGVHHAGHAFEPVFRE